jgi:hypothetical protein
MEACGDWEQTLKHETDGEALSGHGRRQSERVRGRGRERGRAEGHEDERSLGLHLSVTAGGRAAMQQWHSTDDMT